MGREQKMLVAKGLIELGNIVAGAMVFGQFLSGAPFRIGVLGIGIVLTVALYIGGIGFARWGEK